MALSVLEQKLLNIANEALARGFFRELCERESVQAVINEARKKGKAMTTKSGKHTEGPWFLSKDEEGVNICAEVGTIALMLEHHSPEANAHLIASAPEMYDLLKKYHEIIPTPESTALLAKAEGR